MTEDSFKSFNYSGNQAITSITSYSSLPKNSYLCRSYSSLFTPPSSKKDLLDRKKALRISRFGTTSRKDSCSCEFDAETISLPLRMSHSAWETFWFVIFVVSTTLMLVLIFFQKSDGVMKYIPKV